MSQEETSILQLPPEPLGVICSFICDQPTLIGSFMRANKDWFYNLYQDENSNIWAEIVTCQKDKNIVEQHLKEKGEGTYRELVYSIWSGLFCCGENSLFVFRNAEENISQQPGMYIQFDDKMANLFNGTTGFTVEMWINFKTHNFFPVMCCLTDTDWNNGFGLFEYTNSNDEENPNTINMFVQDWYQNPNYFTTSSIPDINEWNHFAGVFDYSDNTVKIYRNGVLQSSKVVLNHEITIREDMTLVIGFSNYSGDVAYHVIGEFNDIRVWNVPRSDSEIAEYFDKRFPKLNFMNKKEYEGLIFNFYPSEDDTKSNIKNKSPNPEYRSEKFNIVNNLATEVSASTVACKIFGKESLAEHEVPQSLLSKMWSSAVSSLKKAFQK